MFATRDLVEIWCEEGNPASGWWPGEIKSQQLNGTYNVRYNTQEVEYEVEACRLRSRQMADQWLGALKARWCQQRSGTTPQTSSEMESQNENRTTTRKYPQENWRTRLGSRILDPANFSGFRWVFKCNQGTGWTATVSFGEIKHRAGVFDTAVSAAHAADAKAVEVGKATEPSHLNFPQDFDRLKQSQQGTLSVSEYIEGIQIGASIAPVPRARTQVRPIKNKTGFRGVYERRSSEKTNGLLYRVAVHIPGWREVEPSIRFVSPEQAARAFDEACIFLGKPRICLNFPLEWPPERKVQVAPYWLSEYVDNSVSSDVELDNLDTQAPTFSRRGRKRSRSAWLDAYD